MVKRKVSTASQKNRTKSDDEQDSLCMLLAEGKMRYHDRELQTGPSSGTYNLPGVSGRE